MSSTGLRDKLFQVCADNSHSSHIVSSGGGRYLGKRCLPLLLVQKDLRRTGHKAGASRAQPQCVRNGDVLPGGLGVLGWCDSPYGAEQGNPRKICLWHVRVCLYVLCISCISCVLSVWLYAPKRSLVLNVKVCGTVTSSSPPPPPTGELYLLAAKAKIRGR